MRVFFISFSCHILNRFLSRSQCTSVQWWTKLLWKMNFFVNNMWNKVLSVLWCTVASNSFFDFVIFCWIWWQLFDVAINSLCKLTETTSANCHKQRCYYSDLKAIVRLLLLTVLYSGGFKFVATYITVAEGQGAVGLLDRGVCAKCFPPPPRASHA